MKHIQFFKPISILAWVAYSLQAIPCHLLQFRGTTAICTNIQYNHILSGSHFCAFTMYLPPDWQTLGVCPISNSVFGSDERFSRYCKKTEIWVLNCLLMSLTVYCLLWYCPSRKIRSRIASPFKYYCRFCN
jgi:hypothetical protein